MAEFAHRVIDAYANGNEVSQHDVEYLSSYAGYCWETILTATSETIREVIIDDLISVAIEIGPRGRETTASTALSEYSVGEETPFCLVP